MSIEEMDDMFEVLYNNITSNSAPGLNTYEKSVFLTKAQNEIVKNYFNARSRGNNTQEGFDDSRKRQIDFSMITKSTTINSNFSTPLFDTRSNTKNVSMPLRLMYILNEMVEVTRGKDKAKKLLQVIPIRFDEYSRLMSKPFKWPLKNQAWRLIDSTSTNRADIVIGPSDELERYIIRFIRRPKPIVLADLDGMTIDNVGEKTECELDPILHEEIVQRAVEIAKAAWASAGQDNTQALMQIGQRSE